MRLKRLIAVLLAVTLLSIGITSAIAAPNNQAAGNIVEVARADGNLTILVQALEIAGLDDTLTEEGPFTLLAPTDEAFAALPTETLDEILADPARLTDILLYHLIPGNLTSQDIAGMGVLGTSSGTELSVQVDAGVVMINEATIQLADLEASNGSIHVIDQVLLPPSERLEMGMELPSEETEMDASEAMMPISVPADSESMNIPDLALNIAELNSFAQQLETAGLVDTLVGPNPFTVFAPSNAAFEQVPVETLNDLIANTDRLANVLNYHIVPGAYSAGDLAALETDGLLAANQELLNITVDGETVMVDGATVIQADIRAGNGFIHVIDSVLTLPQDAMMADETDFEVATEVTPEAETDGTVTMDEITVGNINEVCFVRHTVQAGEWLSTIAGTYYEDPLEYIRIFQSTNQAADIDETFTRIIDPDVIEIGQVLCIPDVEDTTQEQTEMGQLMEGALNIPEMLDANSDLSALVDAIALTDIGPVLDADVPYTVFAPNNEAFNAIDNNDLAALLADSTQLSNVLLYHIVPGSYTWEEAVSAGPLETVHGDTLTVSTLGNEIMVNDEVTIVEPDIQAGNGMIHMIDAVLMPGQ